MSDPNRANFSDRIGRINKIHRAGGGFEAEGTLGKSDYKAYASRTRRRSRGVGLPLFLIAALLFIKAEAYTTVGPDAYTQKVASIGQQSLTGQLGAWLLQPDPVTTTIATRLLGSPKTTPDLAQ